MRQLLSRRTLLAAAVATPFLLPSGAAAANFCAPAPCGTEPSRAFATPAEAVAAAEAAPGRDVVELGAGTFDVQGPFVSGLQAWSGETELRGSGRGVTILTTGDIPADRDWRSLILRGDYARVQDLTLRLASAVTTRSAEMIGAELWDGTVERVDVDADGASFNGFLGGVAHGIRLHRGTLHDVSIDLGDAPDATGLTLGYGPDGGAVELRGVDIAAERVGIDSTTYGADDAPMPVSARRVRVDALNPIVVGAGAFSLSDALLRIDRPVRPGVDETWEPAFAVNGFGPETSATLDRVTLVGNGKALAALELSGGALSSTSITARHLLASGFELTQLSYSWGGRLTTTISHSLVDTRPEAFLDQTGAEYASAARTIDVATGNRFGDSRFRDAAAAGDFTLTAYSPAIDIGGDDLIAGEATDLGGAERPTDGDTDGVVAADAGAFEAARWTTPRVPQDPPPTCRCAPPSIDPPPGPPVTPPAPDRTAPRLSRLTLASVRPRRGAPRRPVAFRFTLSERATVRVALERRRGRRWVAAGALKPLRLAAGSRSIAFRGRLPGRAALAAGSYRAVLVATDAAGNRSTARLVFRLARPAR